MPADRFDEEARRLTSPDERGIIRVQLAPHTHEASVRDLAGALRAAFDAGKADEADETACWRAKAADRVAALTEVADERDMLAEQCRRDRAERERLETRCRELDRAAREVSDERDRLREDLERAHQGAIDRMLEETQRAPARIRELLAERDRLRAELEAAHAVVEAAREIKDDGAGYGYARAALSRYDAARRREG